MEHTGQVGTWFVDPETTHRFKLTAVRPYTVIVLDAWGNTREFARASWTLEMRPLGD